MRHSRRRFVQQASAATAFGLTSWPSAPSLVASDKKPTGAAGGIRFDTDLEPLVRLIEESPREKCAELLADKLKDGLSYRRLLSAGFLAAVRKRNSGHSVYLMYSAHQTSMDLPQEQRLLPLFWAIDHFKWQQLVWPGPALPQLEGALPTAEKAAAEFHEAMKRLDIEQAEKAIVAQARALGPRPAMELLWHYGCRDCGEIGHRAIALTSCWRVLETIGWEHAEPVLRFVVRDLMGEDRYYKANVARAEKLWEKLPFDWAMGKSRENPTLDLFARMRQGNSAEASELAGRLLTDGIGGRAVWDAIHVVAAEMLILHPGDAGMGGRALHINTAANALHYAFLTTASPQTRLLILLQAVAWMADFVRGQLGPKNLAETKPTDLSGARPTGKAAAVVTDVYASLPPHQYLYDYKTRIGVGHYLPKKSDRTESARKVFALVTKSPEAAGLFEQAARHWLCRKATVDAHEYKLPAAMFEDYELVSANWRPRLLAASAHWLHGEQSEDAAPVRQARELLGIKG